MEIEKVIWRNADKQGVAVKLKSGTSLVIAKDSEHWSEVSSQFTEKQIDEMTNEYDAEMAKRGALEYVDDEKKNKALQEERRRQEEIKKLFTTKLEAFEIPEVKESKNKEIRSRIRKSKTVTEVYGLVALLMLEAKNNNE